MDKLEQLLTKMNSEFAEYEAWLLQQPASVILENAFQFLSTILVTTLFVRSKQTVRTR